jgi:membrane-associated phospholipid phosphatase
MKMSTNALGRQRGRLRPLSAVTAAALVFTILLLLVCLQWAPLESADRGAAAHLNSLVADHATLVKIIKAITYPLGSIVCYGAILLVFLPAARGRWRTAFITVIVALGALIGIGRLLLGVHYLSDVLGAWALGITWLGFTTFAFELTRRADGRPVTAPVSEGLEPEAGTDPAPAQKETSFPRIPGSTREGLRPATAANTLFH